MIHLQIFSPIPREGCLVVLFVVSFDKAILLISTLHALISGQCHAKQLSLIPDLLELTGTARSVALQGRYELSGYVSIYYRGSFRFSQMLVTNKIWLWNVVMKESHLLFISSHNSLTRDVSLLTPGMARWCLLNCICPFVY